MTLRQVLAVLWKQAWIIALVTLVAGVTAAMYLSVREVPYTAEGTVRLNPVVTEAAVSGELGGVVIDLDPETVTSPMILDSAAELAGEAPGSLDGAIDVDLEEGARTGRLIVTATGPTAESARDRADAVIEVYRAYVDEQIVAAEAILRERLAAAVAEATALQQVVRDDPGNAIATTNLASTLGDMSALQSQLDAIATSGPTTTVLHDVPLGEPTVPDPIVVLALALLTGIIVGVGAALIRDQFDNRLRGVEEVEPLVGVASLGELRWDSSVLRMSPPLPVASSHRTDLSEGIRTVRSTLQVLIPSRGAAVVVTSVEPGDGKTFLSANLALASARAGKQVILVGGDLRRPDLARYLKDAAEGGGVSDLLEDHADGRDLDNETVTAMLRHTQYRRLRVLPPGEELTDPADILAGPGWPILLDRLRSMTDIVIIDSPPALGLADASLLGAQCDGAVVVSSIGRTNRALLVDTVSGLRANGVKVLGVVANRSQRKLPSSYSSYYLATGGHSTGAPAESSAEAGEPDELERFSSVFDDDPPAPDPDSEAAAEGPAPDQDAETAADGERRMWRNGRVMRAAGAE